MKYIAYIFVTLALGLGVYEFLRLSSSALPESSANNRGHSSSATPANESSAPSIFAPFWSSRESSNKGQFALQNKLDQFEAFPFDFSVRALDGTTLRLSDYQGRVLIVDYWATWCPPCKKEIPSFVDLQTKYGEAGLSIIGFNYERADNDKQAFDSINQYLVDQPINYPLAIGDEKLSKRVPDFRGFPTTLFIDGNGRVRMKLVGACPQATLEGYVKILLDELKTPPPAPPKAIVKRTYPFEFSKQPVGTNVIIENPFVQ